MQQKKISIKGLILLVFSLMFGELYSQTITLKGKLIDKTDKSEIAGATVTLLKSRDSSVVASTVSGSKGSFVFSDLIMGVYLVRITSTGYEGIQQKVALQASNAKEIPFTLTKQATELEGVTVVGKPPTVRQKGDTSEFNASQFKVNPDATAEDMLKKLPGITVAKDGTVTAMGEQVKKVTVDGKDFFGDDATAALKNLSAEIIDKIQVFDRLSDQAQLTGFDDGNSVKSVNIVTKSGIKNGQFGRIYAGAGTDSRYQAGGNISFFNGNRRLSLVGNFNNINQQNFGSQDLLGVSSSGGGGGRGGGGRGGGGGDFNIGQSNGISKTNAAGINFSNSYGKKLTVSGSYFYNNSINTNESITNTETFYNPKNLFSLEKRNSSTNNTNHRINARIEYKIDSSNSLFILPSISFQNNNSTSFSSAENFYGINDTTGTSLANSTSNRAGYNVRNNIMFRHQFPKRGRSFSLGFNTTWSKNNNESITDASYKFYNNGAVTDSVQNRLSDNNTNGTSIGGNINYTEPIGKKGQLQIEYSPTVQKNDANQQTFTYDGAKYSMFDATLSNLFNNTITTHKGGVSYRLGKSRDDQFSVGVDFQKSKLESERTFPTTTSVNQSFTNVLPNLRYQKKVSTYGNIRVFYRASTNFPSISQLQDVVNLNNPLRVSSGNPGLTQSYTHLVATRYSYTNTKNSRSFFANLFLQTANDYITSGTYIARADTLIQQNILLKKGSQLTKPVNLDGYKSLRSYFTYSMPLKFIKTTMNLSAGLNYSKLPGFISNVNTITNSYTYTGGIVFASNVSEFIDFNLSYSTNFNNSTTNTTNSTATKYINQAAGIGVNLLSKKGWFIQNDIAATAYSGLSDGFNQSFWLWNAAIGKKILKKQAGEIKLSVFDLLKQNQSLQRTITGNYIEDNLTQVLQQYFMLTFTYSLKNFGTGAAKQNTGENGERRGPPPGGFGGGFGGGRGGF